MLKVEVWNCDCSEPWWEMKLKQTSKSECPRHFMVEMWSVSFQLKWDLSAPLSSAAFSFAIPLGRAMGFFLALNFHEYSSRAGSHRLITDWIKTQHIQHLIEKFGNVMTSALFCNQPWVHLENSDSVQLQHSVASGLWFYCKDCLLHH